MNIQKLQSEIEIMNIRMKDFQNELNDLDAEIQQKLLNLTSNNDIITALNENIQDKINGDKEVINKKWAKKMKSTREAFKKDQIEHKKRTENLLHTREIISENEKLTSNNEPNSENSETSKNDQSKDENHKKRYRLRSTTSHHLN